jgi:hypothetical protein
MTDQSNNNTASSPYSAPSVTVQQAGKLTRAIVSRDPAPAASDAPAPSSNSLTPSNFGQGRQSVSISMETGETTYNRSGVHRSSAGGSDAVSGPVAVGPMGAPLDPSRVTPRSTIRFPDGTETSLAAARAAGLVSADWTPGKSESSNDRESTGNHFQAKGIDRAVEEPRAAEEQEAPAAEDTSPYSDFRSSKPVPLNSEAEGLMQEAVSKVSHGTAHAVIGTLLAGRDVSPDQLHQVGSQLGIAPEEAKARIGKVVDGMREQVVNAVGNEVVT